MYIYCLKVITFYSLRVITYNLKVITYDVNDQLEMSVFLRGSLTDYIQIIAYLFETV